MQDIEITKMILLSVLKSRAKHAATSFYTNEKLKNVTRSDFVELHKDLFDEHKFLLDHAKLYKLSDDCTHLVDFAEEYFVEKLEFFLEAFEEKYTKEIEEAA